MSVRVELELATSEAEALLRHVLEHTPATGDFRHDAHLREAFETLADALRIEVPWVKKTVLPQAPPAPNSSAAGGFCGVCSSVTCYL